MSYPLTLRTGLTGGLVFSLLACGGGSGGGGGAAKPVVTVTSTPGTAAVEAHPYRYVATATSSQGASLQFSLISGPVGATMSGSTLDWTPSAAQAGTSQTFRIKASDGGGAQEQSWSVAVSPNQSPSFSSTPPTAAKEGREYLYDLVAADPEGDTVQFSGTQLPAGAALNGARLTWTPTGAEAGQVITFKVVAHDGLGGTREQAWSVTPAPNGIPFFSTTPPAVATEAHAYTYDLAVGDPDGDPVQLVAIQLPPGAALNGAHLTWTPSNAEVGQVIAFKVAALDGLGGTRDQIWTVTPAANAQPVITSQPPADVTFVQGAPVFDYALTGTDADGDALSYTLVQAPAGATLVNGILHWRPTPSQERVSQTFQVHAADGHGGGTDQQWTKAYSGVLRGTWADVYQSPSGAVSTHPSSLVFGNGIHAFVSDGSGGFRRIDGALNPDGSMALPGIPPGEYWVSVGPGYLRTDRGTLDVGQAYQGRPDAVLAAPSTPLTLTLSNMDSWSNMSTFIWQVPNHSVWVRFSSQSFASNGPVPGDTGLSSAALSYFGATPLVDASKGDVLYIHQPTSSLQGALSMETIGKTFTTSTLIQTAASGGSITGAFVSPPVSTVNLDWDATQAAGLRTQVRPDITDAGPSLDFLAQPGGLANGFLRKPWTDLGTNPQVQPFLAHGYANVPAHFQQPLTFKDPYPIEWPRAFVATHSFVGSFMIEGVQGWRVASITTVSDSPGTAASPLKAIVSPVQHPTINGLDFFLDQTGVGTTPTLAWDPPALGPAVCYLIRIKELQVGPTSISYYTDRSLDMTVHGTSIQIPPGILTSGKVYFIEVKALTAGPGYDPAQPYRFPLPLGLADCISGLIQP